MKTEEEIKTMIKIAKSWLNLKLSEKEKVEGFIAALKWVLEE